jgi:hypothetical protein
MVETLICEECDTEIELHGKINITVFCDECNKQAEFDEIGMLIDISDGQYMTQEEFADGEI